MNDSLDRPVMALITRPYEELDEPALAPEAQDTQAFLLAESAKIIACTNPSEARCVSVAARTLQTHIKAVQEMGLKLRRPATAWAQNVKRIEDEYVKPLLEEKYRFERLAGDFAASERRRVAVEEAARQAEIQRLEKERKEAEAALIAASEKLNTPKQLEKAIQAEQAVAQATEAAQAAIRAPLPAAAKVAGMPTKREMAYAVTDLAMISKHRPELVKMEIKASAVRAVCVPRFPESSDEIDDTSVPGLSLWWTDSTSTRAWRCTDGREFPTPPSIMVGPKIPS